MNAHRFDTMTRRATGAPSRRRSLLALAGAAVATAVLSPSPVAAGKNQKARKRAKKKCKRQVDQCRNVFLSLCEEPGADCEEGELESILPCCDLLKDCKAGEAVDCLVVELFS